MRDAGLAASVMTTLNCMTCGHVIIAEEGDNVLIDFFSNPRMGPLTVVPCGIEIHKAQAATVNAQERRKIGSG
jgi:hypothetical protein